LEDRYPCLDLKWTGILAWESWTHFSITALGPAWSECCSTHPGTFPQRLPGRCSFDLCFERLQVYRPPVVEYLWYLAATALQPSVAFSRTLHDPSATPRRASPAAAERALNGTQHAVKGPRDSPETAPSLDRCRHCHRRLERRRACPEASVPRTDKTLTIIDLAAGTCR
jgi:hypothetical protein